MTINLIELLGYVIAAIAISLGFAFRNWKHARELANIIKENKMTYNDSLKYHSESCNKMCTSFMENYEKNMQEVSQLAMGMFTKQVNSSISAVQDFVITYSNDLVSLKDSNVKLNTELEETNRKLDIITAKLETILLHKY